ncbi:hypothetical protein DPX16_0475 [Anabarilius grahami]|uniref:Uncharacterized protein n=1 Tax=Anabarilius grahami TaxID=495550 RepID=A0A3N0Z183_ANAGA|nr:hypothetical protein DPX16_0475 [Anabarilius grahami]
MGKRKDLSEFDKDQIVMARDWVRASPKLQLLWGVPGLQCFKRRGVFIGQSTRGRSTNTDPAAVETYSAGLSFENDCTVGRHTAVQHQRDKLPQSVIGAPAPFLSALTAAMKRKRDEMNSKQFKIKSWPYEPWIYRDQQLLIKRRVELSNRIEAVRMTLKRIYISTCLNYDLFSKYSNIPVHQNMSLKIFKYINDNRMYFEKVYFENQFSFNIIVFENGSLQLIGPFTPMSRQDKSNKQSKCCPDLQHTEEQSIAAIEEYLSNNENIIKERQIKSILNFTNNSPCLDRKDDESCTSKLGNFSEKIHRTYNIKVYNFFVYIFGATGRNILNEIQELSTDEDPFIKYILLWLKEMVNEEHRRSKFTFSQINQTHRKKSDMLQNITTEIKKITDKNSNFFLSSLHKFEIVFPSNPLTLEELKSSGKQQADELKIHVKQQNVSEEISEKVCLLFHSEWCKLIDKEYIFNKEYDELELKGKKYKALEFKYLKLCDVINAFTVNFALDDMKTITNHYHLTRVDLSKFKL